MKRKIFYAVALVVIVVIAASFYFKPEKDKTSMNDSGFVVAELFTSEGCSSCPAADALLAKLSEAYEGKFIALAFHVDYWNRLGWADAFSTADFTKRQQNYSRFFKLNSVYTPQVIINGKAEMVGSNESRIRNVITQELKNKMPQSITLSTKSPDDKTVNVTYNIEQPVNSLLQVALVQKHAETSVKRGENAGRTLNHINVVRDFKTLNINSKQINGSLNLTIPDGLSPKECNIIAYLQDADDMHITAATELSLK
ncbi:hypothetical protein BH11BAC6_BH11BAC6_11740 [soil metagenome]